MHSSVLDFAKRNLGLSTDPKLYFRSVTLPRLHNSPHPIPYSDLQYWSHYSNLFDFPSDVPTLISLGELRKAILLQPDNVINLVKFLVNKLDFLVHSESARHLLLEAYGDSASSPTNNPSFTGQLKGLGQSVPSSLLSSAADIVGVSASNHKAPKGPLREILNCIGVLTRILPLLLEYASLVDQANQQTPPPTASPSSKAPTHQFDWILLLLWLPQPDSSTTKHLDLNDHQVTPTQPQFVIDEEESSDEDPNQTPKLFQTKKNHHPLKSDLTNPLANQPSPASIQQPLMVTLINTILDLLFLPGVCVPSLHSSLNSTSLYPVWTAGIGCSQVPPDHSASHNSTKVQVLRLLLAVLSRPLYSPPHLSCSSSLTKDILALDDDDQSGYLFCKTLRSPNPALTYITTQIPKPQLLALLCSLLNTSLAPTGTAFSSPANALNSLASGFGRITQSKNLNLSTPPPLSSASSFHSVDHLSNLNLGPRRTSSASNLSNNHNHNNSASSYGGACTTGISQNLPEWCAVVLSLFLLPDPVGLDSSHQLPPRTVTVDESDRLQPEQSMQDIKSDHTNQFRIYLSKVHRTSDLSFLIDNILIILMKPMTVTSQLLTSDSVIGSNSLFTNSFLNYGCGLTEAILILYLSLDCNPRLMNHLISTQRLSSIIIGLTFICLEQKDHPKPKNGLVKLCAITLQLLTANERKESSYIFNSKVELPVAIRAQYSVPGTLADFLIVSICSFIFSTSQVHHHQQQPKMDQQQATNVNNSDSAMNLNSIYTPLVLTITNLSPYLKEISKSSSARLIQLFTFFSSPTYILSDQHNHKLVYYILETFNNIIHFQIQDNPYLIYSLIKVQKRIHSLATFTLKAGLIEIQKKRNARRSITNIKNKANSNYSPKGSPEFFSNNHQRHSIGESFDEQQDEEFSSLKKLDKGKGKMKEIDGLEESLPKTSKSPSDRNGDGEQGGRGRRESSLTRSASSDQFLVVDSSSSTRKSNASCAGLSNSIDPASHTISRSDWSDLDLAAPNDSSNHKSDTVYPFGLSNPNSSSVPSANNSNITVNTISRSGFVPTEAWVASWRDSLPLDTIQIMLTELKPKVTMMKKREEEEGRRKKKASNKNNEEEEEEEEKEVINLLRSATLIGMIPKPKKKSKRSRTFDLIPFNPSDQIKSISGMGVNGGGLNWLISFIWSIVFIKDSNSNQGNFFTGSSMSTNNNNHQLDNNGSTSTITTGWETNCLKIKLFGLTFLPTRAASSASDTIKGLFKMFSNPNPPQ